MHGHRWPFASRYVRRRFSLFSSFSSQSRVIYPSVVHSVVVQCAGPARPTDGRCTVLCRSTGVHRDSSPPPPTTTTTTGSWKRRRPVSHTAGLSMLSRGHEYHLAPGSLLSLDCEFYMEAFHAFHNPVIWVKSQSTPANGGARRIKINVMRIIQPPFSHDEDRFDVTFIKQPPRYELLLTVKGTTLLCVQALT